MDYLCICKQPKEPKETPLCVAVVGEASCGKTSLIYNFTRGRVPDQAEMLASTLDTDSMDVTHGGKHIKLTILDTSGHEDYAKVRALTYAQCDVVLLCFPLDSPESLQRILSDWAPEVRHMSKGKPLMLVGTKRDLREVSPREVKAEFVSRSAGKRTARKIGAMAYKESSACEGGLCVKRVFGRAIREGLRVR